MYGTGDSPSDVEVVIDTVYDPLTKKKYPLSHFAPNEQKHMIAAAHTAWVRQR